MTERQELSQKIEDLRRLGSDGKMRAPAFVDDMAFRFRQQQFISKTQAAAIREAWDRHCKETTHVR